MRWKIPSNGDTRIVVKFPFVPLKIEKECRWLEICYVKQIYKNRYEWEEEWKNSKFVSKKDYDEYIASTKQELKR
jgi:hypothetical protein